MVYRTAYSRPYIFLFGVIGLLLAVAIIVLLCLPGEAVPIPVFVILSLVVALLWWMLASTRFEITNESLTAQTGPFRRTVPITSIVKVVYDDQLFKMSIWKVGCSHHGLMVHYDKYEDIYISPQPRDKFVEDLCRLNPSITVHR